MKEFVDVGKIFEYVKKKKFSSWIDKLTFYHILFIWIIITILVGLAYYFLTDNNSYLLHVSEGKAVDNVMDAIYFSFIGSTTTGYGDIIPHGAFKFIYPFEVILALMLVAIVASKLVSVKQGIILSEIYDLSFYEKINELRSSLLLFRQNLSRVITKIEDGSIRKREISDVYMYLSPFEDILNEILVLTEKSDTNGFTKRIDPTNTELLLNSSLSSFEKINELVLTLNINKIDWRREVTLMFINKCIELNEELFSKTSASKIIPEKIMSELNSRKKGIIAAIKNGLSSDTDKKTSDIKIDVEKK